MDEPREITLRLRPEQWELVLDQLEATTDMAPEALESDAGDPDAVRLIAEELDMAAQIRRALQERRAAARMQLWIGHALGDEKDWFLVWAPSKEAAIAEIDGNFWEPDVRSMRQLEDEGYVLFHPAKIEEIDGAFHAELEGVVGLDLDSNDWVVRRVQEPLGEPTTRELSPIAAMIGVESPEVFGIWSSERQEAPDPAAAKEVPPEVLAQAAAAARAESEPPDGVEVRLNMTPQEWGALLGQLDVVTDQAREQVDSDSVGVRNTGQAELDVAAAIRRQMEAAAGPEAVAKWHATLNRRYEDLLDRHSGLKRVFPRRREDRDEDDRK